MSYIGSTPTTQSFISGTDYFNGTGSQTAFTLTRTVASVNDIEAVVNNVVQQPNDAYTISGTTITFTSAPSSGTSNIYVRYLSTTTQAITPSQGTVSWSTLNSDTQQDLGISFKNRIINGAMVIDQRNAGASVTPTTGYILDRWVLNASQNSKFTFQQNQNSVTPPAGFTNYLGATTASAVTVGASDYFALIQRIEGYNVADLGWGTANAKTVTLSFQIRSSLTGTFGGAIRNDSGGRCYPFSYTVSSANTWTTISVTIAGDTSGTWLTTNGSGVEVWFNLGAGSTFSGTAGAWTSSNIVAPTGSVSVVGTNGATFYLTGVMLEVGTQATTFDYRSYGTELSLCQRYYWKVSGDGASIGGFGSGQCASTVTANIIFSYPVTMRTAPTIAQGGTYTINFGAGNSTVSSITAYTSSGYGRLDATISGATTGFGAAGWLTNGTSNFITGSAEL
jgi:hypothetical protein